MHDYRIYFGLISKKIIKYIDRKIKKIILINYENRKNRLNQIKYNERFDLKDKNSVKNIKGYLRKIKNLLE